MKSYFYSAAENGFMPAEQKDIYIAAETWPDDAIEVSEAVFEEFTKTPPDGKIRGGDNNGMPSWLDAPALTHEENVAAADYEKQRLINEANDFMNSKQWPGKAAIGRLKGTELDQYRIWLDYLDALEAVDTSTAPDIEWPSLEA